MTLDRPLWPPTEPLQDGITVPAHGSSCLGRALLLHGITGTPLEMLPLAESLAAHGIESYVPLLPGHGTTLADLNATKTETWLSAAESALSSIRAKGGSGKLLVAGLSFGSILALWLMRKSPQDISHVALLSPPLWLKKKPHQYLLKLLGLLPQTLSERFGSKQKSPRAPGYLAQAHYAYPGHSLAASARVFALRDTLVASPPPWSRPLVVAFDPRDHLIDTAKGAAWLRRTYPHARFVEVPGGEHELLLGHHAESAIGAVLELLQT